MDLFRSVDIGKAKHEGSIHVMHPPRARLHVFEGKLTPENKEDKAIKNIRAHPFACRVSDSDLALSNLPTILEVSVIYFLSFSIFCHTDSKNSFSLCGQ